MKFAAVEAVEGYYKFIPPLLSLARRIENLIFRCTPLHDYESTWWIAIWVISSCKLNTTNNDATVGNELFSGCACSSVSHNFLDCGRIIPEKLHLLVGILKK